MGEDALHQRDAGRSEDQTQEAVVSGRALERGVSNNSLVSSADMSQDGLGEAAASRRTCCGRKAWLYPELPWGAPPETDTTHMRGASFLAVWEMVTFLCCLYVAVSVPYNVTFAEKQGNIQLQKGEVPPDDCVFLNLHEFPPMKFYMSLADLFVDFIFYIDIVLNFHCACWEISTRLPPGVPGHSKTPQWVMIDDLVDIRARYIRGEFATDILGQIPWQYSDCFLEGRPEVKILRLFRLLKLLRLHRLKRMIKALYRKFPKMELVITGIELLITMTLVAHWMACIWYIVGYPSPGQGPATGWVVMEGIVNEDKVHTEGLSFFEWVSSFYWAITTMSTIGYGDISASTSQERMVAVVVMCIGCAFFAWITGRITHILTKESICTSNFEHKMEELNEWMDARVLSQELVDRIKGFYMIRFPTMKVFHEARILEDLPTSLRKETYIELYRDIVCQVPMFSICQPHTQREICYRLRIVWKSADLAITTENQVPDALYIVRTGIVGLYADNEFLKEIGRGEMFGENALFGLSKSGLRTRTAVARTMVELCELSQEDLFQLLVELDDFFRKMTHMTNGYLQYLEIASQAGLPLAKKDYLCVCWKVLAQDFEEETRQTLDRQRRADPSWPGQGENGGGLCTKLSVHIASFREEVPAVVEQVAVMRITWPGYGRFPKVEDEGTVIVYGGPVSDGPIPSGMGQDDGLVTIHQTLGFMVRHQDADWEHMPDVELSLWKFAKTGAKKKALHSSMSMTMQSGRFLMSDRPSTHPVSSIAVPSGIVKSAADVAMGEERAQDTTQSVFDAFVASVRGITVKVRFLLVVSASGVSLYCI